MATYEVKIYETVSHIVEVEANNADEALDRAFEVVTNGIPDTDYETESEGFNGSWNIYEIEQLTEEGN